MNWTIIQGTFSNDKIRPSDIDGQLVFNGCILQMEVKWINTVIPEYLDKRFLQMTQRNKYTKVLLLWGDFGDDDDGVSVYDYQMKRVRIYSNGKSIERDIDNNGLKHLLRQFKAWAEKQEPLEEI